MKIIAASFVKNLNNPISKKIPYKFENKTDTISFSGIQSPDSKALFAFDIDGTFAHGNNENIEKILEIQQNTNAVLTYATGRTCKEFIKFQDKQRAKGLNIPTPDYLISNNGQFIHKNVDGELVEDFNWRMEIKEKTGFDREAVYNTLYEIAHYPEYKYSKSELEKIKKLDDYSIRLEEDPKFLNSKISYYDWNPSIHMLEYFVASDVDIEKLKQTISNELLEKGIKAKFILNHYPKDIMDACSDKIIRQSRPIREDSKGNMTALFICPSDKADGVKYLANKLNIPNDEIVMAGNESNDISMANMTKIGSFFICVKNASKLLKEHIAEIFSPSLIKAEDEGNAGIIEGLNTILDNGGIEV